MTLVERLLEGLAPKTIDDIINMSTQRGDGPAREAVFNSPDETNDALYTLRGYGYFTTFEPLEGGRYKVIFERRSRRLMMMACA